MGSLQVSNSVADTHGPFGVKGFSETLLGNTTYKKGIRLPPNIELREGRHYLKQILPGFDVAKDQKVH
ncbi:MAG: hypothetical protein WCA08_13265 [Desulfoferrobacter sp.]